MRLNIYHFRSQADEHYKQLRQLHEDVPLIECKLEPGSVYMKGYVSQLASQPGSSSAYNPDRGRRPCSLLLSW